MPERTVVVGSSVGLHARPAAMFVQAAAAQPVKITVAKPGGTPGAESTAAHAALEAVASQLEERAARAAQQAAGVLAAQAMMARDPGLADKVSAATASGRAAVLAVMDAFGDYRAMLAAAGPY